MTSQPALQRVFRVKAKRKQRGLTPFLGREKWVTNLLRGCVVFVSGLFGAAISSHVYADATWNGAVSTDWETVGNWDSSPTAPMGDYFIQTNTGNIATISAGITTLQPVDIYVGKGSTTNGRLDHTGGSAQTGNANWMFVGVDGGTGTYNLANTAATGGTLTGFGTGTGSMAVGGTGNAQMFIGSDSGSSGTVNVNTTGTLSVPWEIWLGNNAGTGTLKMDAGTINQGQGGSNLFVGNNVGSTGTLEVSGGTLNVAQWLLVAPNGGTGTVTLSGTGEINQGAYDPNSRVELTNPSSAGTATVNLDGGTLLTNGFKKSGTGTANLNFNGTTVQARIGNSVFLDGVTGNVEAGGAIFDTNGNDITIGQQLLDGGGGGGLTKDGAGTLTMTGANTYTGDTTLGEGILSVGGTANSALGTGGTVILSAGTLTSNNAGGTNFNPILNNNVTAGGGSIEGGAGTQLHIAGNISGSAPLGLSATFNGSGLRLEGDNSGYTGTATVTGANTRLGSSTAGSANAAWQIEGNLQTDVANSDTTFHLGSLSGSGNISGHSNNSSTTVSTISVGALNTSTTFSGTIVDQALNDATTGNSDSAANNQLALTKIGTGALTLTGDSTYTGVTTVSAGMLIVNGDNSAATGNVTVASGATLGGTGTVGGATTIDSGGTVSPGESIGTLTTSSDLTLNGTYLVEYDDSMSQKIDLLNVGGLLDISSATVDFMNLGTSLAGASYTFATYSSLSGGAFASVMNLPGGYTIDYAFGGNNIALRAVPEASSFLCLALVAGACLIYQKTKRRSGSQATSEA